VTLGRVVLVGAGPGDPELITVKGARALAEADVVVYDRLAAPALLDLVPPEAERVYVGKEPAASAWRQGDISALLVERARAGATVVRLKGGDPFVFGRGGEELLACAAAGVPCEVVPGVTSATAAPAAVGIPVTHRGVARSFAVVTASIAGPARDAGAAADLSRVATAVDTVIVLMAAGKVAETCAALIAAGRPPDEAAALVMRATTPDQRTVRGTLRDLPVVASAAGIGPPATLVVGEVAGMSGPVGARSAAGGYGSTSSSSRRSSTAGPSQATSGSGRSTSSGWRSGSRTRYAVIPTARAPVSSP
jgi:uroporphyrin-III C-methyltransferase